MGTEAIVSQNTGEPLGKIVNLTAGGAFVVGSASGSSDAVPNISTTIKANKPETILALTDEDVIISTSASRQYGTIKTLNTENASNYASLSIDSVLSKLNTDIKTFPSWGPMNQVIPGQMEQIFAACGIPRWYVPGKVLYALDGTSPRTIQRSAGSENAFYSTNESSASSASWWPVTNKQTPEVAWLATPSSAEDRVLLVHEPANLTSAYSSLTLLNVRGSLYEYLSVESKRSGNTLTTTVGSFSAGNTKASTVMTLPSNLTDTADLTWRVNVTPAYYSASGITVTITQALVDSAGVVITASRNLSRSTTLTFFSAPKAPLLEVVKKSETAVYLYRSAVEFDVENAVPYMTVKYLPHSNTSSVAVPGVSGTGWTLLNNLMLAYGYTFDTVNHTVYHKSRAQDYDAKAPGELGYMIDKLTHSQNSRELGEYVDITYYDYKVPSSYWNGTRLWTSTSGYSIAVGEQSEEVITLEDNTSMLKLSQPILVDPDTLKSYISQGKGDSVSAYSVFTTDGLAVTRDAWESAGGSITVSIGDTTSELVLTINGPSSRIYPGNDEKDNGTYDIVAYPDAETGIVIAGLGVAGNKSTVRTWTGASGASVKELATEYDNPYMGDGEALWNTAAALAEFYGSPGSSVSCGLSYKGSRLTPDPEDLARIPRIVRQGNITFRVRSYNFNVGGIDISSAEVGTSYADLSTYYEGMTYAQVDTLKSGSNYKTDTLYPAKDRENARNN